MAHSGILEVEAAEVGVLALEAARRLTHRRRGVLRSRPWLHDGQARDAAALARAAAVFFALSSSASSELLAAVLVVALGELRAMFLARIPQAGPFHAHEDHQIELVFFRRAGSLTRPGQGPRK